MIRQRVYKITGQRVPKIPDTEKSSSFCIRFLCVLGLPPEFSQSLQLCLRLHFLLVLCLMVSQRQGLGPSQTFPEHVHCPVHELGLIDYQGL